jgi:hypothetical protein
LLSETHAAIDQVLLDIPRHQLHFEIGGVGLGDFLQPVKNRFEPGQIGDLIDLCVQALELV